MIQALVRFVVGGLLVAILPAVAARLGPSVAGTVLLFPAVSFAGLLAVGRNSGIAVVASTSLSALLAVPTVIAFLLGVFCAARRGMPLAITLLAGVASWLMVATPIVLLRRDGE